MLPRPLAGGQFAGDLGPRPLFHNPVARSHNAASSVRSVVVARIHPRTWTLNGSQEGINRLPVGSLLRGRERRETRRGPEQMGSLAHAGSGRIAAVSLARHGRRRGRVGVVKLLRARGGCLGVIRWRAWKAAKGPGELPNERRSRNARWRPGELKHLSTRRNRNQPRLPQ